MHIIVQFGGAKHLGVKGYGVDISLDVGGEYGCYRIVRSVYLNNEW